MLYGLYQCVYFGYSIVCGFLIRLNLTVWHNIPQLYISLSQGNTQTANSISHSVL